MCFIYYYQSTTSLTIMPVNSFNDIYSPLVVIHSRRHRRAQMYQNQNQNNFISEIYNVSKIKLTLLLEWVLIPGNPYKWTLPLSHRSPIVVK